MGRSVESIGKYRVLRQLAQGGMGTVYIAQHPTLDRTVIIKKLTLRGNTDIRERFRREAQIMMELRNDAIVDVYDHFREGASYYIVLEFVDGMSLEALILRERYLPNHVALLICREVCRGLAYAHARGVIHRDIKPANILISHKGAVKLVDFGIATVHGQADSELTREGMTLGTPSYMAPEQFQNSRNVDRRADIYSLGVVLYEAVTGKRPYPGTFSAEVIARIQKGRYERPRRVNPKVEPFTARLIRRMLRPKPVRRFVSLEPVIRRIDRQLGLKPHAAVTAEVAGYLAGGATTTPRRRRPARRALIAALAAFLAIGGAWTAGNGYQRELFQPGAYGALDVTVRMAPTGKPAEDLYLAASLHTLDGEPVPVRGALFARPAPEFGFSVVPEEETGRYLVFRSRRIQVPPGEYELRVAVESTLFVRQFAVESLRDTSAGTVVIPGRREDAARVSVDALEASGLPLEISWTARDRVTGRPVEDARAWLWVDGGWRELTFFLARTQRSGAAYRIRFTHPDYISRTVELDVPLYRSTLRLDVGLAPIR